MKQQIRYFASSLARMHCAAHLACPSCGSSVSRTLQRKYVVTALHRCEDCRLMYRTPTTPDEESFAYYQDDYRSGVTTELPDESRLDVLMDSGFKGTAKDFTRYISLLSALGVRPGARVLDFGASWGYGVWQLRRAGFDAIGYEVSRNRAAFASERLGVPVMDTISPANGLLDIFFSAHVLEHLPSLRDTITLAMGRLAPGGYFVAITPNGSVARKKADPRQWSRAWGLKHPNLLDEEFYRSFSGTRRLFLTSDLDDLDAVSAWAAGSSSATGPLDGGELLAISHN